MTGAAPELPADPADPGDPAGGRPAEPGGELYGVEATVRLASAGLHVIDRWTDALLDALQDLGAAEPQVGGSLTGGRIEVHLAVTADDLPDAAVAAAGLLRAALAAAATPGVRVVGLASDVSAAGPAPS